MKKQSSNSAMNYIADKKNQQKIIKEVCQFNDSELKEAYQTLFDWSGDIDSYVENKRGNRLYNKLEALNILNQKKIDDKALRKFYQTADKHTANELLRFGCFLSNELCPLIVDMEGTDQEALIYQIKTFSPTISPEALCKLIKRTPTSDIAANLLQVCLQYGTLSAQAVYILRQHGTPEQIRLYEER